MTGKTFKLSA